MESGFYQTATAREAKARGQTLQDVAARLKKQGIPYTWAKGGPIIVKHKAPERESTKPLNPALKAQQKLFNRIRLKILKGV